MLVMNGIIVISVHFNHFSCLTGVTLRKDEHLIIQWRTDKAHEFRVTCVVAVLVIYGVTHGCENHVIRIDKGSVCIKKQTVDSVYDDSFKR